MKYNRIKEVLEDQGRTQKWLCDKIDKHTTTVNRWCNNDDQPSLKTIYLVAQTLGVSPKDLLYDKPEEEGEE